MAQAMSRTAAAATALYTDFIAANGTAKIHYHLACKGSAHMRMARMKVYRCPKVVF